MNFNLHFGELHGNNSFNDKNNLFENYIPKCYKVKRILISFNCFSEYRIQAVIRTNGGVTKCEIACQIFTRNEINSKMKCFVVIVLYMCIDKT